MPNSLTPTHIMSISHNKKSIPSPTKISYNVSTLPSRPSKIPYTPTEVNISKLKEFIIQQFSNTAFNIEAPFPAMDTQPAHIHLKPDATPYATHIPIPIPHHWKNEVKESIDKEEKKRNN